jgi:hypothetical protein
VSEVLDRIGIRASDLMASRRMYDAALAELGFVVLSEGEFEVTRTFRSGAATVMTSVHGRQQARPALRSGTAQGCLAWASVQECSSEGWPSYVCPGSIPGGPRSSTPYSAASAVTAAIAASLGGSVAGGSSARSAGRLAATTKG